MGKSKFFAIIRHWFDSLAEKSLSKKEKEDFSDFIKCIEEGQESLDKWADRLGILYLPNKAKKDLMFLHASIWHRAVNLRLIELLPEEERNKCKKIVDEEDIYSPRIHELAEKFISNKVLVKISTEESNKADKEIKKRAKEHNKEESPVEESEEEMGDIELIEID